jgi:K+-sensing histidine kinase KdpD
VRGILPRVLRQVERLDRAVTGALRVSRGMSMQEGAIQLSDVLDAAGRAAEPEFLHRAAALSIDRDSVRAIQMDGDPDALHQLFLNLLINAAQALGPSGEACVSARSREEWIEITIADNGAGMTADQLATATEPYRSSKRNGTGLGLKIARRIVGATADGWRCRATLGLEPRCAWCYRRRARVTLHGCRMTQSRSRRDLAKVLIRCHLDAVAAFCHRSIDPDPVRT